MKKLLTLSLLLLAGCIYVEDIGIYWDKGIVDKELLGEWKQEKPPAPKTAEDQGPQPAAVDKTKAMDEKSADSSQKASVKRKQTLPPMRSLELEDWIVTEKNNEYYLDASDDKKRARKSYKPLQLRTLIVGNYTFFMTDPVMMRASGKFVSSKQGADLWRYARKGKEITLYQLNPAAIAGLLAKKYPGFSNIVVSGKNYDRPEKRSVGIKTLDDQTLKLLADVPDNEEYWAVAKRFTKVK